MTTSVIGAALLYSDGKTKSENNVPEKIILEKPLTEEQKSFIISNGGSYITFTQPPNCGESCATLDSELRKLAEKYNTFVYYFNEEGTDIKITIENLNGKKELNLSGGLDTVEEEICSVIEKHPSCIELKNIKEVLGQ